MLNFANETLGTTQIFTQKNPLKKNILIESNKLENIIKLIAVIKEKIDTTAQGYQKVEKLFKELNRKKYELNQKISQKKKEFEKLSIDLNQLKNIYNDCNLKYENIEELSIIDAKSEPMFRRELKKIKELLINYKQVHQNGEIFPNEDNELDLKEKLQIINQNLNEITYRRDERNRLIVLKNNAYKKLKVKKYELNSCENQLTMLITQEKQLIPIDSRRNLVENMIKIKWDCR